MLGDQHANFSNHISFLSANMASPSPLIKFDVCLYKKDEISYEDFVEWATKVYPVKAKPLIQKYVVKWTQASHSDCPPASFRKEEAQLIVR